jgi:hypothetical protein
MSRKDGSIVENARWKLHAYEISERLGLQGGRGGVRAEAVVLGSDQLRLLIIANSSRKQAIPVFLSP